MSKTTEDVLAAHVARMRQISEAEIRQTARLGALHTLLIYRTGTANVRTNQAIDNIMEQLIIESGATNLPSDSGGGSSGSSGGSPAADEDPGGSGEAGQ